MRVIILAKLPAVARRANQRDDVMLVERQLVLTARLVRVRGAHLESAVRRAAATLVVERDRALQVRH